MARVREKYKSRQFTNLAGTVTYLVDDLTNYDNPGEAIREVVDYLETSAPGTEPGGINWLDPPLVLNDVAVDLVGPELYEAAVAWGEAKTEKPPEKGELRYEFALSTTNQRVTNSIKTIDQYPPVGIGRSFNGLISVNPDGQAEGVDILIPQTEFSYTYTAERTVVTESYLRTVEELVGTVADDSFFGRPKGEVLFLGSSGRQTYGAKKNMDITFRFARSPNREGIEIPGLTKKADKLGWELLWVYYYEQKDSGNNTTNLKPQGWYVEQVYEYGDFFRLGPWVVK